MSEQIQRESSPDKDNEKKPYEKPALTRHGTVADLTRGTSGTLDSDASSNIPPG